MNKTWKVLFSNGAGEAQVWLRGSLSNGQCFNWTQLGQGEKGEEEIWQGVLGKQVVYLKQLAFEGSALHPVYYSSSMSEQALHQYFRSEVDLETLYLEWSRNCARFLAISTKFRGIRVLRQDKFECILSFITSSNNNIKRIHSLLHKLRQEFGSKIEEAGDFYAFPSLEQLQGNVNFTQAKLREMGFGYRAKYLADTVRLLGADECKLWEMDSSSPMLTEELCKLSGVGRKVADCIALFAFDRLEVVPVDVHVFRIAKRDYNAHGELDELVTMNKQTYAKVYHEFYSRFGSTCGWAHSVLFTCELAQFRDRVPKHMLAEMDLYKKQLARDKRSASSSSDEGEDKRFKQQ
ncbi:hypothetical protein BASA81_002326 [Batrachochytrium salamandrivorans]|nr:hypothetical protein BASA81_002326 [Batrachochytrium salamandrivorans]